MTTVESSAMQTCGFSGLFILTEVRGYFLYIFETVYLEQLHNSSISSETIQVVPLNRKVRMS